MAHVGYVLLAFPSVPQLSALLLLPIAAHWPSCIHISPFLRWEMPSLPLFSDCAVLKLTHAYARCPKTVCEMVYFLVHFSSLFRLALMLSLASYLVVAFFRESLG